MPSDWSKFSLKELREIATKYNKSVKISGAHKMKRGDLESELDKHMTVSYDEKGGHKIAVKEHVKTIETTKQKDIKDREKIKEFLSVRARVPELAAEKAQQMRIKKKKEEYEASMRTKAKTPTQAPPKTAAKKAPAPLSKELKKPLYMRRNLTPAEEQAARMGALN